VIGAGSPVARRRALIAAAVAVAVVAVGVAIVVIADPFGGGAASGSGGIDNGSPTSTTTIVRRSLSSQTQVSATLGYADPSTIVVPSGTAPSAVQQAQQAVTTAESTLDGARSTQSADATALAQVRASLEAARAKEAVDCAGANAAGGGASGSSGSGSGATPCASDQQAVSTDEQSGMQAEAKLAGDETQVSAAEKSLAGAQRSLAAAQASASLYGQTSTYTELPPVGQIVRRGQTLYAIDGQPVLLLGGRVAAWRAFTPGMSPGSDVAELNSNLRALGYGRDLSGRTFTAATEEAVKAFQAAHGLDETGQLLLGSVVFESRPVRVTSVTPTLGATVQPGPVLGTTSTVRQVTIALDAAQQSEIKVGDPVVITLPDNRTTPGRVSYVGSVATTPSSDQGGGGSSSPTIEVDVTPTDPAATGRLDQAPVNVSITTASVHDVLVVPVNALLALASGGYALEEVESGGAHRLVAVELGLFDDADGLVQVSGTGLAAGQRIVVPAE
jgi:peptidoglycan hydrolase-like protein with peptidoglycan-binding domain